MPCDTIQQSTVNFNLDATNVYMLRSALESLGYQVSMMNNGLKFTNQYDTDGQFVDGKLTVNCPDGKFDVNELKRAYSGEVVKNTAKRFGWKIKAKGNGKFQVMKGGF